MSLAVYIVIGAILIAVPLFAARSRRWMALVLYAAGSLAFLYVALQNQDGWDDLADLAVLMVVTAPLYVISTCVWLISALRRSAPKPRNRK